VKVSVCGLCHTDLDEIEGRLTPPRLPIVPGHQVVGTVAAKGQVVTRHRTGDRVGITWLHSSCGQCSFPQSPVFVFTRGDHHKRLAEALGAVWAGAPQDAPPAGLDRAIDFTPVGETVRTALSVLNPGGRLVINAIRKTTAIPALTYDEYLWDEKEVKSVANVTRRDATEFLPLAARIPICPTVREFAPEQVNEALRLLKQGKLEAAAALRFAEDPV